MDVQRIFTVAQRFREEIEHYQRDQRQYPEIAGVTTEQVGVLGQIAARVIVSAEQNLLPLLAAALPFNQARSGGIEHNEDKRRQRAIDDTVRDAVLLLAAVAGLLESVHPEPQPEAPLDGSAMLVEPALVRSLRDQVRIHGWQSLSMRIAGDDLREFFKWADKLALAYQRSREP